MKWEHTVGERLSDWDGEPVVVLSLWRPIGDRMAYGSAELTQEAFRSRALTAHAWHEAREAFERFRAAKISTLIFNWAKP